MALRDHRACPAELRNQVGETSLALVDKCLAGRSTTKEKAIQALLLFMQIGAVEPVLVCSPTSPGLLCGIHLPNIYVLCVLCASCIEPTAQGLPKQGGQGGSQLPFLLEGSHQVQRSHAL